MKALRIARGVGLPLDYVTKTAAILAQRRKGKTYTAAVLAEELVAAGIPWVALDPTGAWWGLRSSADGQSAGLPVVVVGGQHGDAPLERGSGAIVADLVLDHPGYYVLDLSLLGTRAAEREFATAFAERLYRRKMQPGMDFPLHLFVDEADMFVPQEREGGGDVVMLGAFQAIVRRGGLHGLGATLISQRPALVNKSVLTQLDLLVLLRLVGGQDQDAVDRDYVKRNGTKEQRAELMDSLASLKLGEAWLWEPGAEPALFERVRIRERRTFNSSATPKPGETRVEPKVLADVDLDALRERMAASIERAKDDDPAELRRQLRELQRQTVDESAIAERISSVLRRRQPDAAPEQGAGLDAALEALEGALPLQTLVRVEVPAVPEAEVTRLEQIVAKLEHVSAAAENCSLAARTVSDGIRVGLGEVRTALENGSAPVDASADRPATPRPPPKREDPRPASPRPPEPVLDGALPKAQQRILDGIAWWDAVGVGRPTRAQVAFVVGYNPKSRGFTDPLYSLNTSGRVRYPEPGRLEFDGDGRGLAGYPRHAPNEQDLQRLILDQVGTPRARILVPLLEAHPDAVPRGELAEIVGYQNEKSRGFTDPLYRLRSLGLVEYPEPGTVRATDLCFLRR